MKYCNDCKVSVCTSDEYCPLCGDQLAGSGETTQIAFPKPKPYAGISRINAINKMSFFAALTLAVICVIVNVATFQVAPVKWSAVVAVAVFYGWYLLAKCILKKGNATKVLFKQLITVSVLAVSVDVFLTDFSGWSLSFALPILALSLAVSTLVITLANLPYYRENLHYSLLVLLLGSLQLFLLFFVSPKWLVLVSGCVNFACLATLYLVAQKRVNKEIVKRLHI